MTFPKIASDDLVLFGSLALAALGVLLVVVDTTGSLVLALGSGMLVFGIPAALIAFLAAAEPSK